MRNNDVTKSECIKFSAEQMCTALLFVTDNLERNTVGHPTLLIRSLLLRKWWGGGGTRKRFFWSGMPMRRVVCIMTPVCSLVKCAAN
jgi:hypothetical protein